MDNNLDNQNLDNQNQDNQNQTFSKEEVDKMLQSETDKRVSQAIATAKAKWEEEFNQKLESEKSEALKLAKMNEEERYKMELEKQKAEFETEKKQFLRERMELETVKELSALNLPTDFAKYLLADTAEEIKQNIQTFKTHFEQALEKAVSEKLQGTTPKTSTNKDVKVVTKEEFNKLNYAERMAIYEANQDLYKQLTS